MVLIRESHGGESDSFVFQLLCNPAAEILKAFDDNCAANLIHTIVVMAQKATHVVAVFPKVMHKPNACKMLLRLAMQSGMGVDSDLNALDVFHAEMFGWKELPAQPDLHKVLAEDDDDFDPRGVEEDEENTDEEHCNRATREAAEAKQRIEELQAAGGISQSEESEGEGALLPVVVPETRVALPASSLVMCGLEFQEAGPLTSTSRAKPEKFNSFDEYTHWLQDVPAKRLQNQAVMLRRPSHVTVMDALRMDPDRRLQWVLFRLQEAGLILRPKLEHFPPFYKVFSGTMERATPHAKFDLAKKLFVKWATLQNAEFALPAGRIESWPIDIRCKVQSVTKGKLVKICDCGKITVDGLFCSDECKLGHCQKCGAMLEMAAVGPLAETPSGTWAQYITVKHQIAMLQALQEKTIEDWQLECIQNQADCLECSEFEANHFIKREVCHNPGCMGMLPCDECFEFHRFYDVNKQECNMCNFHVHEKFIESLRRFSIDAGVGMLNLARLQERFTMLQHEMRPRRLSVRVCLACDPNKRQRFQ